MFRLIKMIKDKGRWRIFKLKLIDARLYFVSIFVGLLTGLVAVPYHISHDNPPSTRTY